MERLSRNQYENIADFTDNNRGKNEGDLLTHLKELVLSVDWEITNDILGSFTREINRLRDVWIGEKVFLVYLQAMEKITRYVYVEKSDAHPGALKLLSHLYDNLERVVFCEKLSEEKRKEILCEDVRRFTLLKEQIQQGIIDQSTFEEGAKECKTANNAAFCEENIAPEVVESVENINRSVEAKEIVEPLLPELKEGKSQNDSFLTQDKSDAIDEPVVLAREEETFVSVSKELALQGVNVDTEADDDICEDELPHENGELAPALSGIAGSSSEAEDGFDIEATIDSFFANNREDFLDVAVEGDCGESGKTLQGEGGGQKSVFEENSVQSIAPEQVSEAEAVDDAKSWQEIQSLENREDLGVDKSAAEGTDTIEKTEEGTPDEGEDNSLHLAWDSAVTPIGLESCVAGKTEGKQADPALQEEEQPVSLTEESDTFSIAVNQDDIKNQENATLLVNYCKALIEKGDNKLLRDALVVQDQLIEGMEGEPLKLHFLLLFTAVADYLEDYPQDMTSHYLLLSIAETLQKVLSGVDLQDAQKLLLRESARVLDWFGKRAG